MDIKRAKTEIINSLKAYLQKKEDGTYKIPSVRQRPILLIGPPGIGKTAIMEQVAAECGIGLVAYTITHHTRQSAVGLPFIEKKNYEGREFAVTKYTMSEIIASVYEKMEETGVKEGLLFIDEINCVSETLAPTMLQFLQGKTFGNERVPEGWVIVAAGNPPEYNKSVREFDVATLDRVKRMDIKEDYEVWKEYASRHRIHNSIISYLDIKKENFYSIRNTVDGRQFVTARGWEDLSELLYAYEELGLAVDQEVVGQYLQHPKIARDFTSYLELYHKYRADYDINAVADGNYADFASAKLKKAAFDERYSVISLLLDKMAGEFCGVWQEDLKVSMLFEMLKKAKAALLSGAEKDAGTVLAALQEEFAAEEERRKKLPAKDGEKEAFQNAVRQFEEYTAAVRLAGRTQPEDAFELIREKFGSCKELREQKIAAAGEKLTHCFEFLADTFGEGQELVIFLTELSLNYYSVEYLGAYGNAAYEKYNKELLYTDRRHSILSEIGQYQSEMNSEIL